MVVKRYRIIGDWDQPYNIVSIDGTPYRDLDGEEIVLASDYDALAAEFQSYRLATVSIEADYKARIRELESFTRSLTACSTKEHVTREIDRFFGYESEREAK